MGRVAFATAFCLATLLQFNARGGEVLLPGEPTEMLPAAGGGLLVCRIESLNVLVVVDAVAEAIRGYIPIRKSALVAAGMDEVLVGVRDSSDIERWSLETLKKLRIDSVPDLSRVGDIAVGCASQGPLWVIPRDLSADHTLAHIKVLSLETFQPIGIQPQHQQTRLRTGTRRERRTFASDSGYTLIAGQHMFGLQVSADVIRYTEFLNRDPGEPSFDGRFLHPAVWSAPIAAVVSATGTVLPGRGSPLVGVVKPDREHIEVTVMLDDQPETLAKFELPHPAHRGSYDVRSMFEFLPNLNRIVRYGAIEHTLEFFEIETKDLVANFGKTVLRVPPLMHRFVKPDDQLEYSIGIVTNRPIEHATVTDGPPGMSVTADGLVKWHVPKTLSASDSIATVQLQSADGTSATQQIVLELEGVARAAVPAEVTARLYRAGSPIDLTKPRLEIPLPSRVREAKIAGSGRYLLLDFPELSRIAVFDISEARVTGSVWLPRPMAFTGGGKAMFLLDHEKREVQRWDLPQLERVGREIIAEKILTNTRSAAATCLIGSAADDLILMSLPRFGSYGKTIHFLDAKTLQPVEMPCVGTARHAFRLQISASGTTITSSGTGLQTFVRTGPGWQAYYSHVSTGMLRTSAEGLLICTAAGVGPARLDERRLSYATRNGLSIIPPESGPYAVRITPPDRSSRNDEKTRHVELITLIDTTPVVNLSDLGLEGQLWILGAGTEGTERQELTFVELQASPHAVVIHRIDLEKRLYTRETPYLFVESMPNRRVNRSEQWSYALAVRSPRAGLEYKLVEGPDEMTLDQKGAVNWAVPPTVADSSQDVSIEITDAYGNALTHSFEIEITDVLEQRMRDSIETDRVRLLQIQAAAAEREAKAAAEREAKAAAGQEGMPQ